MEALGPVVGWLFQREQHGHERSGEDGGDIERVGR